MKMKDTEVLGRFSRAYALLAGLVVATLVASLMVLLTDAEPAHAAGEEWYGTVEASGTGAPFSCNGIASLPATCYNSTHIIYEAPISNASGTMSANVSFKYVYDPQPSNCDIVEEAYGGVIRQQGVSFSVSGLSPDPPNSYRIMASDTDPAIELVTHTV
jgi:hypothetical protein